MATTTNYGWTTPDDTALVKDGAAAIRTLGTSVDTTTKALNPSTTLGDIEYRSSTSNTNTRLGIGSTGNVLTVAGGVPSWAAPAASPSGCTLVKRASFSSVANTGTTFDGIFTSTYQSYMVIFEAILPATGTDTLHMQFRYAGPTTQTTTYYAAALLIPPGSTIPNTNSGSTTSVIPISGGSNSATVPNTGQLFINGVGNSSERGTWNGMMISPNSPQLVLCAGMNDTPETYTGLIFKSSSSNITGTIAIYGWAV
jgi:hypothetical protein